jgi:hypothetical protein
MTADVTRRDFLVSTIGAAAIASWNSEMLPNPSPDSV